MIDFTSSNVPGNDRQRLIFPPCVPLNRSPRPPDTDADLGLPGRNAEGGASSSLIVIADTPSVGPALLVLLDRFLILKLLPILFRPFAMLVVFQSCLAVRRTAKSWSLR